MARNNPFEKKENFDEQFDSIINKLSVSFKNDTPNIDNFLKENHLLMSLFTRKCQAIIDNKIPTEVHKVFSMDFKGENAFRQINEMNNKLQQLYSLQTKIISRQKEIDENA